MTNAFVTCTPLYKVDATNPWVTQEGPWILSLSLSPNSDMTLEDAAKLIENFPATQVSSQPFPQPRYTVRNMTFRGQVIHHEQFVYYRAVDYMHDGESFNLLLHISSGLPILMVLCPCCILCLLCKRICEPNPGTAPQAQQMHPH